MSVPCPGLTLCGYQLLTVSVPESGGDSSALAAGLVAVVSGRTDGCLSALLVSVPCPG